jgi:putative Holliday junction resolvase
VEPKEILALDVGAQRTGVARASNVARLAEPLISIPTKEAAGFLKKYTTEHSVEAIAIGLPRSLAGEDTEQTRWVRNWVDKTKNKLDTPLYLQDEAMTSKLAERQKLNLKDSVDEHALAAAVILQDFLDNAETGRMVA